MHFWCSLFSFVCTINLAQYKYTKALQKYSFLKKGSFLNDFLTLPAI